MVNNDKILSLELFDTCPMTMFLHDLFWLLIKLTLYVGTFLVCLHDMYLVRLGSHQSCDSPDWLTQHVQRLKAQLEFPCFFCRMLQCIGSLQMLCQRIVVDNSWTCDPLLQSSLQNQRLTRNTIITVSSSSSILRQCLIRWCVVFNFWQYMCSTFH